MDFWPIASLLTRFTSWLRETGLTIMLGSLWWAKHTEAAEQEVRSWQRPISNTLGQFSRRKTVGQVVIPPPTVQFANRPNRVRRQSGFPTFIMALRHYVRTSATRYRRGNNRTKVKTFVTSAWYHWWHAGPYFGPCLICGFARLAWKRWLPPPTAWELPHWPRQCVLHMSNVLETINAYTACCTASLCLLRNHASTSFRERTILENTIVANQGLSTRWHRVLRPWLARMENIGKDETDFESDQAPLCHLVWHTGKIIDIREESGKWKVFLGMTRTNAWETHVMHIVHEKHRVNNNSNNKSLL